MASHYHARKDMFPALTLFLLSITPPLSPARTRATLASSTSGKVSSSPGRGTPEWHSQGGECPLGPVTKLTVLSDHKGDSEDPGLGPAELKEKVVNGPLDRS